MITNNSKQIKKGDTVLVTNLNQTGTVLGDPQKSKKVQVQIGPARLNIDIKNLSYISSQSSLPNNINMKTTLKKDKHFSTEINVIGHNLEEAIFLVDKFLDDCILADLSEVRIVHGKGTGTLKNGIHTFLKKHPHVSSFRLRNFWRRRNGRNNSYFKRKALKMLSFCLFLFSFICIISYFFF